MREIELAQRAIGVQRDGQLAHTHIAEPVAAEADVLQRGVLRQKAREFIDKLVVDAVAFKPERVQVLGVAHRRKQAHSPVAQPA